VLGLDDSSERRFAAAVGSIQNAETSQLFQIQFGQKKFSQ